MKKIEDIAAQLFILAVAILSLVSILGVWDIFSKDTITKSFETLGLLAIVAIIVMVAGKFMDKSQDPMSLPALPNPIFKTIRQMAVTILIISVSILAILGVMAIWEIISDKDVLYKSMSTVGILAFSTFIIVITSLDREGNKMVNGDGKKMSTGTIVLIIVLIYMLFSVFRGLAYMR